MSEKTSKSSRILTVPCFLSLLLLASVGHSQESEQCSVTDKVADLNFTLKDVNGIDVLLSDYAGKVILLDFWATWCAPCRIEIPGFIEFNDKYDSEDFAVLGISVDDPVDSLLIYMEDMEMNYPVLIGDGRDDVKDSYGPLYGFPSTFLIARDGSICHQHTGFAPQEQFEQEIEAML